MTVKEMIVKLLEYPMEWELIRYEHDERGGDYFSITGLQEGRYTERSGQFEFKYLDSGEPAYPFNALRIE